MLSGTFLIRADRRWLLPAFALIPVYAAGGAGEWPIEIRAKNGAANGLAIAGAVVSCSKLRGGPVSEEGEVFACEQRYGGNGHRLQDFRLSKKRGREAATLLENFARRGRDAIKQLATSFQNSRGHQAVRDGDFTLH